METGRVPVILSDRYVPPADPAWRACVLHIPESRLAALPSLLAEADRNWPELAARASTYWRENYADDRMARTLVRRITALLPARPPGIAHCLNKLRFALRQSTRNSARFVLARLRR